MELEKVIQKQLVKLRQKNNVVAVGKGRKIVGGVDTGRTAIVVGVRKKLPVTELDKRDIVPKKLKGYETDVVELGEIKLLDEPLDRKSRIRPAPGGCSIGHKDITAGTLGRVVRKNGIRYILSNNHVLANVNKGVIGDAIYQPGSYDGGTPNDEIAWLSQFVAIKFGNGTSPCPVSQAIVKMFNFILEALGRKTRLVAVQAEDNLVDCALAKPNNQAYLLDEILEVGVPDTAVVPPDIGIKVKKSGRTTGLTQGEITIIDASVNVNMGEGKIATFTDQFVMGPMSAGGDSGSVILTEDNKPIGLLFAGSEQSTIANKYSNVVAALGLD